MRTPSDVLCKRLDELAHAVADGPEAREREFTMRVPAELERDADLVLSQAAQHVRKLESAMRTALERSPLVMADAVAFRELLEPPR
jgi:hypothetical protein